MLFEPWGGSFRFISSGASLHGWANSQPLDLIDGYDVTSGDGRRLLFNTLDEHDPLLTVIAFTCTMWTSLTNLQPEHIMAEIFDLRKTTGKQTLRLVRDICIHRQRRHRYFLVENPSNSQAWSNEGILHSVYQLDGVYYATGSQCVLKPPTRTPESLCRRARAG